MKTKSGVCLTSFKLRKSACAAENFYAIARGVTAALALVSAALFSNFALADTTSEVSALMKAGQFSEALSKTDAALALAPRDKQMRFLKGVLLTELNRPNDAIVVFTKLTEDFPELPEPYNNLAVLFAANGQYDKARAALEMAIRTNPTYATAHENLGDVYAKLASQAYDKALQLDSGNATAKSKLTLIRTLVGTGAGTDPRSATVAVNTKAPAGTAAVPGKAAAPVAVAAAPAKPIPPLAKVETKPEAKVDAKPEEKPVAKVAVADPARAEVISAVNGWAKAWSAKDVATYLAYYTSDFQPTSGQTHKAWAEDRRVRIEGKGSISVNIGAPQVSVDGNTATVRFRQQYISNQLRSNGPKTLVLVKQSGKWQIKQERSGS